MERQIESYLPGPSYHISFGVLDPLITGTRVINLATSYVASAGIITSALATGVGAALAVVVVVYSFVTSHQAEVKARRKAREARWEAFYQFGIGLITDVYGSIKDFEWSHAHDPDSGWGEYYNVGAMFYYWSQGAGDPIDTPEDKRFNLISYLVTEGLEPTRFLGYENVALDESLDAQIDFVHRAEKKVTAKEILMGFGYTAGQLAAITDEEPLIWLYDSFQIDLPNLSSSDQAQIFLNDVTLSLSLMGLDSSMFQNKVSEISSKGFKTEPSAASTSSPLTASLSPLTASLSSSGGILIIGMAAVALLGMKKSRRRK
jgi:hypothetical protein